MPLEICVAVGAHGAEGRKGKSIFMALAKSLVRHPIRHVHPYLVNPRAAVENKRYISRNISSCYPGDPRSTAYEQARAWMAGLAIPSGRFDLVIDGHDTATEGDTAAYICDDPATGFATSYKTLALASMMQFKNIVIFPRRVNITGQRTEAFSADIAPDSPLHDVATLRDDLDYFANEFGDGEDGYTLRGVNVYRHVAAVSLADRDWAGLPRTLPSFSRIDSEKAELLELPYDARALSWGGSTGEEYEVAGEVIVPSRFNISPTSSGLYVPNARHLARAA